MPPGIFTPVAKYGPNGQTWAGRGRKPKWLKEQESTGSDTTTPVFSTKIKPKKTSVPTQSDIADFKMSARRDAAIVGEIRDRYKTDIDERLLAALPWKDFFNIIYRLFPSQRYGKMAENRVRNTIDAKAIDQRAGAGDFRKDRRKCEFKVSFKGLAGNFNLLQLRAHETFTHYMIVLVDFDDKHDPFKLYLISKFDMGFFNQGLCHGNSDNTQYNKTKENRLTLTIGSPEWEYLQEFRNKDLIDFDA